MWKTDRRWTQKVYVTDEYENKYEALPIHWYIVLLKTEYIKN